MRILIAGVLVLALLGCFLAIGAVYCSATLHATRVTGPRPEGAQLAEIMGDGNVNLKAWWFQPKVWNQGCVIVLHGISDSRADSSGFAPMFLFRGYAVLAPDSRAHGESGGEFVTYGLLEKYDVVVWAHWMRGRGCQRIYGLGESLGASVLIQAISVEPAFRAVVAECPYSNLQQVAEYRMRKMMNLRASLSEPLAAAVVESGMLYARFFDHVDFRKVSPIDSLRASSTPLLLIHGLNDTLTPTDESRRLAEARPKNTTLWLVPGASHTNASSVAPVEFNNRVLGWFAAN